MDPAGDAIDELAALQQSALKLANGSSETAACIARTQWHHSQTFKNEWAARSGLINSVDRADVKGFPPGRWPPRGFDRSKMGIATLLTGDASIIGRSASELMNEAAGGTLLVDPPAPAPKLAPRAPRLKSLLDALKAAPWKRVEQNKPAPSRRRRAAPLNSGHSGGGALLEVHPLGLLLLLLLQSPGVR